MGSGSSDTYRSGWLTQTANAAASAPRRALLTVLVGAAVLAVVLALPLPDVVSLAVDDLTEALSATAAAAVAAFVAVSSHPTGARRGRAGWGAVAAGSGAWAAGQWLTCWYEVLRRGETPFPGLPDLGFLLFPVGALTGILLLTDRRRRTHQVRAVLDGAILLVSMLVVVAVTVLQPLAAAGDGWWSTAVSWSYPLSDVLVATVVLQRLSSDTGLGRPVRLLAVGAVAMAVSDTAYTWTSTLAESVYTSLDWIDVGWTLAFALIALSALHALATPPALQAQGRSTVSRQRDSDDRRGVRAGASTETWGGRTVLVLPQLLLVAAVLVILTAAVRHSAGSTAAVVAGVVLGILVSVRQALVLLDNRRLVEQLRRTQDQLEFRAFHDPLTGLANRALFHDRLSHALDLHQCDKRPVGVIFLDLDDFKSVNDSLGHQHGDQLLVSVAERLRAAISPGDTIARLGGDEFAILIESGERATSVSAAAVLDALARPFLVDDRSLWQRASVGYVEVTDADALAVSGEGLAAEVLRRADVAMYVAKTSGKGRAAPFRLDDDADLSASPFLATDLKRAIAGRHLTVELQPVFDLAGGGVRGVEALARWEHGVLGQVSPAVFVPLAERTGLIRPLECLVLDLALTALGPLRRHVPDLSVGGNITAAHLSSPEVVDDILGALRRHGLPGDALVVEVTETVEVDDFCAVATRLSQLRCEGVQISLDDFGAGHTSIAYLHQLPLDSLKLDRSLLTVSAHGQSLLTSVVDLAHSLGLRVVAEGVETAEQLDSVRGLGCDFAQGYLLARPQRPEVVDAELERRAARAEMVQGAARAEMVHGAGRAEMVQGAAHAAIAQRPTAEAPASATPS
ncbi:MAG: putative bifunctional diguanylate cyclase/phosphodiesterase [Actinomycetes bacterium]